MTQLVVGQDFRNFVRGYQHTAFRLEVRDWYNEPQEKESFRRFLTGDPDYSWNEEWRAMQYCRRAEGKRMTRLRIVTEPHTDYVRFMLDLARINVPAGEDIRYLPRDRAKGLDLPDYDFWLIDSTKVGILHFGEDDILLGTEILDAPDLVVRHCYYRDVACHYAVPFAEYVGS